MICAETTLSFNSRSSLASRRSMRFRSGGVISTCRPVISTRINQLPAASFELPAFRRLLEAGSGKLVASKEHLPLVRRRDLELLAVLGDGAPRQDQSFLLQDADDLGV